MTATVDANVLLYASDEDSQFHARALAFLESIVRGPSLVYLFWPTLIAYMRVATHAAVFASPLTFEAALANVDGLIRLPHVQTVGEQDRFWHTYVDVASDARPTANLVPGAHLVALMRENGIRSIWTNDRDFRRFAGIDVRDPFA